MTHENRDTHGPTTEWTPLADGVTDIELHRAVPLLVLHSKHLRKQDIRAFCIRLAATLVHERRRP